ncbi:uncharacterized protein TrAtP1_011919 [Trichoderma atroviride]|uniref:uncharacterized protein n=1 Tax=Hypocrea atroviridis TaxID=63577 RepID=UPI0033340D3B|nr:hypothetical protein TrAtP1_011919 [Trichoderma atroviride]
MAVAPVEVDASFCRTSYSTRTKAAGGLGASEWRATRRNILEQMKSSQLMQRVMSILATSKELPDISGAADM